MPTALAAILLAALALAGCEAGDPPREPGPHQAEREKVSYWAATGVSTTWEGCTDDPSWRAIVDSPEVDGSGDFVLYRVAADGSTALQERCQSTDPATCTSRLDDPTWSIAGHRLTLAPPAVVLVPQGTTCELHFEQAWTLDDQGDRGLWTAEVAIALSGGEPGACAALDASVAAGSPNGLGIEGCVVRFAYPLVWFRAR